MKTLKLSYYDWLGQCSLKTKTPNLPLRTPCTCQPKAVSSNCAYKIPNAVKNTQGKMQGVACKSFWIIQAWRWWSTRLRSHLSHAHVCAFSCFPWSVTEDFFLRGSSTHNIFASAPDCSGQTRKPRQCLLLMVNAACSSKAALGQVAERAAQKQTSSDAHYIWNGKAKIPPAPPVHRVKCEICNWSLVQSFISAALGGVEKEI